MLLKKLKLWSLFVQFCLHSIILNCNYFVCDSIVATVNCFFPIWIQWGGGRGSGSFFFKHASIYLWMRGERGESKKGQLYANIIEWLLITLYYKMQQKFISKCVRFFIIKWDRSLLQNVSGFLLQNVTV